MIALGFAVTVLFAANGGPYDAARDYEATHRCFAAYLTLSRVTTGAIGQPALMPERRDLDAQAERGFKRMAPFARAAMSFKTARVFYDDAGRIGDDLEGLIQKSTGSTREDAFARLLAEVRRCDALLDSWSGVRNPASS